MVRLLSLTLSHALTAAVGFAAGIYALPLMIQPEGPAAAEVQSIAANATYSAQFRRDLAGSDFLHWGEGVVTVSPASIALLGKLAPGPDYKLYLTPGPVTTGADFLAVKSRSVRLGDVRTFTNFIVPVPANVDIEQYDTVVVWCETFEQLISAAQYR